MDGVIKEIGQGVFLATLAKRFYEREAVFAAAYKYRERFYIKIEPLEETDVNVWFEAKEGQDPVAVRKALGEFCNEVLDQQCRLDLEKRFGNLREVIYKKAFMPILGEEGKDGRR